MRILIFSDTHGNYEDPIEVIKSEPEVSAIIHAGDMMRDAEKIRNEFPCIQFYSVPGNCDFCYYEPSDIVTEIGGKRVLITHGHEYSVKSGLTMLKKKIEDEQFDLVVFGHTHKSVTEFFAGAIIVNPGSMSGIGKTYAVADIVGNKIKVAIEEY